MFESSPVAARRDTSWDPPQCPSRVAQWYDHDQMYSFHHGQTGDQWTEPARKSRAKEKATKCTSLELRGANQCLGPRCHDCPIVLACRLANPPERSPRIRWRDRAKSRIQGRDPASGPIKSQDPEAVNGCSRRIRAGIVKSIPRFGGRPIIALEKPSAPAAAENTQALAPRAE